MPAESIHEYLDRYRRWAGVGLILIGIGWLGVAQLPAVPGVSIGGLPGDALDLVGWAASGLGVIHLGVGAVLIVRRRTGWLSRLTFRTSLAIAAVVFVASAAVVSAPDIVRGGTISPELLAPAPVYVCYIAALLFPLGVAADPRHRYLLLAGIGIIPVLMLVAIPLLAVLEGGWVILVLLFTLPVVLVTIPIIAIFGLPLYVAGRTIRRQNSGRPESYSP
ncbi:hypothetical protein AArcCO_2154 [Halalkaliarchaeum sp. AArc-CO]|uniref:hypothetical protein n=1 Tax=Halalkaliarchaeum sp. AArc-CO TaxID=2866381 RepID=UPI00217DEC73|nr:hypothetical protein [Halalkaliarchaeum sp. AArc-CO]UWG51449.1 hypothetical protein AArcCO_2154 [Halalkaliarchaeum sp. AArc-CO]